MSEPRDRQKIVDEDKIAAGDEKSAVTLPGVVEKIIKPSGAGQPEKAQIAIEGAEDLYKEIRIDNTLADRDGEEVKLKQGAEVNVTIEAADVLPA